MPDFRYPTPTASPQADIAQYIAYLLTAVEEALDRDDVWPEGEEDTARGYMEDLKTWIAGVSALVTLPTATPDGNILTASGGAWISAPLPTIQHSALGGLTTGDPHTQYPSLSPASSARNVFQAGGAAVTPLTLQGATSQSADLVQIKNAAGTVLMAISPLGHLAVGANGQPPSAHDTIYTNRISNDNANQQTSGRFGVSWNSASPTAQRYIGGLFTASSQSASSGNLTNGTASLIGGGFSVAHNGSGTATALAAGLFGITGKNATHAQSLLVTDSSVASGANWVNWYGIGLYQPSGAGTIGTAYGLYVADITKGGTANYAVKSGLGLVSFGDVVETTSDTIRIRTAKTPATSAAAGVTGDICIDDNYIYVRRASGWKRAALGSW